MTRVLALVAIAALIAAAAVGVSLATGYEADPYGGPDQVYGYGGSTTTTDDHE